MALALKLDADKFGGLDDTQKSFYVEKDGSYQLDVTGLPEVEDVSGLKGTIAKLKDEKTALQRKSQEATDEAARIAKEKAEKENDFESLYKSSEEARQQSDSRFADLQHKVDNGTKSSQAMKIAAGIASSSANAEILSNIIVSRLKVVDGETKVTDLSGALTVATVDDLAKEFAGDEKYASLLQGNQAGGGGAEPKSNGGGAAEIKTVTRTEFNAMDNLQRSNHAKSGGQVTDD